MPLKIKKEESFGYLFPDLAKEWHPNKNDNLSPFDVSRSSSKKVWWKCKKGYDHEWQSIVSNRSKGSGCPICSGHKVVFSNSLLVTHPDLAKKWHPTKNGNLKPSEIRAGSSKKVWWKCDKADDHEWQSSPVKKKGCTVCSGKKVVKSNSLPVTHPDLVKEWHPTKNGNLKASEFHALSSKKVWWKCDEAEDHEWETMIKIRTSGSNCPVCVGQKIVLSNCLATLNPNLAKQWHPTKNGDLTSYDVSTGTNKKVWWKCEKGDDHEWKASIEKRHNRGQNCPICSGHKAVKSNCLATLKPDIAKQWHPTKNGELTAYDVTIGSGRKVWWQCEKHIDHEWSSPVARRVLPMKGRKKIGSDCPFCLNKLVTKSNCLATLNPNLAKQWHPTKNGNLSPYDVTPGTHKKVWWKCEKGDDHEWRTRIILRSKGSDCPICSGHKAVISNSLATLNPEIARQWHPTKNGNLTPYDVTPGSNKKVWWKCEKGEDHEWEIKVGHRLVTGCTICSGHKVVKSNCLATLKPEIAKQWHPTKNGELTPYDVTLGSARKVWWQCEKDNDHTWITSISKRVGDQNCPYCSLTPQSKQELKITFELIKYFPNINPRGFKTRINNKLVSIDIYIPELKLGIEFDGSYWHKGKREFDKLKTKQLEDEGFEIFRVREEPLKRIFEDDIMSKQPFNAKQVSNDILKQIMSRYTLDDKKVRKIEKYLAKKELQNEKGLDEYIDMILTKKAEKK